MTRKERLWTVLIGGEPDRIPWSPCITDYYLKGHPRYPDISPLDAYLEAFNHLVSRHRSPAQPAAPEGLESLPVELL